MNVEIHTATASSPSAVWVENVILLACLFAGAIDVVD